MMYCLTWAYRATPDKTRCVVGAFSDVKQLYNSLVDGDKVASETGDGIERRMRRLHGARGDAVGVQSAPMLCWGTELALDPRPHMHENIFEMT